MHNPYFRTKYYREETSGGKAEAKIEKIIINILFKLKIKKDKNV